MTFRSRVGIIQQQDKIPRPLVGQYAQTKPIPIEGYLPQSDYNNS